MQQKYDNYKPSGVAWLGDIPKHWEVIKLKYLADLISLKILSKESSLNYIGMENIESWTGHFVSTKSETEGLASCFEEGDVLFGKLRPYLAKVYLAQSEGICSTEFLVYRASDNVFNSYLHLTMLSFGFINLIDSSTYGSKMPRASSDFIGNQLICVPSIAEQTAIADYLDAKTAQIDTAIRIKEKQIELLKERRQILIHKAVTQGLDPSVKMKESGVEWIGVVPEHWEVKKLKYLLNGKLKYGANESGIEYDSSLPRYVRITDFGQDGKLSEDSKLSLSWKKGSEYLLKDGDILFARSGATVGKTYQFKKSMSIEDNYCYAGYLIKAEVNADIILSDFLYLYTSSQLFNKWKDGIFIKATIENIGADKYAQLPVILPPVKEQITILERFNANDLKIALALHLKIQEIAKLKEYKATVINAAVTGQLKVKN